MKVRSGINSLENLEALYGLEQVVPHLEADESKQAQDILDGFHYTQVAGFAIAEGGSHYGIEFRRSPMRVREAVQQLAAHASLEECVIGPLVVDGQHMYGIGLYIQSTQSK